MSRVRKSRRPVIGRSSVEVDDLDQNTLSQSIILVASNGINVEFKEELIPHDKLTHLCIVDETENGRYQADITPASIKSIVETIKIQQFYPCYAKRVDGKIYLLDGSLRLAAAIEACVGLRVLITDYDLSVVEGKRFATQMQSATPHSHRDFGMPLLKMQNDGMSIRDIASKTGINKNIVERTIISASVPDQLVRLFPKVYLLSHPNFKLLSQVSKKLSKQSVLTVDDFINSVNEQLGHSDLIDDNELDKDTVLAAIKSVLDTITPVVEPEEPFFEQGDIKVDKKVGKNSVSYKLNNLPQEIQSEIDAFIAQKLKQL